MNMQAVGFPPAVPALQGKHIYSMSHLKYVTDTNPGISLEWLLKCTYNF